MNLEELRAAVEAVKIGGRVVPADLSVLQQFAYEEIMQLCYPLNLLIPYRDSSLARFAGFRDGKEWFLRSAVIARNNSDFIDIDERLEFAFVNLIAAAIATDADRVLLEQRAERICLEYACDVEKIGFAKAKELYEQESYIDGVSFSSIGKVYTIDAKFIEAVVHSLLCGVVEMSANGLHSLELYKRY